MSINYKVTTVNSKLYSIAGNDEVIMVNSSDPTTIVLPSDNTNNAEKRVVYVKDYSGNAKANPITIISAGEKTIDNAVSVTLNKNYDYIQLIYDGKNWKTLAESVTKNKKLKE